MDGLGITDIGHVAIRARDLDRVLAFYTGTLGFPEMFRLCTDAGDLMLVYVRVTDRQYLEFFPNGAGDTPPREAAGLNHLCLAVADLGATVAALAARGIAPSRGPQLGRDGNRQAWIEDPEGNRIELMELAADSRQAAAIARLRDAGRAG
ncbi:MAG TPA: VOC family protein [Thermomicrobiales bacterium]|nr:VOC family protein [Thermomicrobiales bacterium]